MESLQQIIISHSCYSGHIQFVQITTLQARLEHQTNRNSRKSVIIRRIPQHEKEKDLGGLSKSSLREAGRNYRMQPEVLSNSIKRIHRGKPKPHQQATRSTCLVLRLEWIGAYHLEHAEARTEFEGLCRTTIWSTWRRNNALALRKDLKAQGTVTSDFIAYPAKLMVKYNAQDRQYTMHQVFFNTEVPVQTRRDNNSAA